MISVIILDEDAHARYEGGVQLAFDDLLPPLPDEPISMTDGSAVVRPYAATLRQAIEEGFAGLLAGEKVIAKEQCMLDELAFSVALHSCVVSRARVLFAAHREVTIVDGQAFLLAAPDAILRFKKLNSRGMPCTPMTVSGIETMRQRRFDMPVLTIGITIDKPRSMVQCVDILCMRDVDQVWWRTPLPMAVVANAPEGRKSEDRNRDRKRRARSKAPRLVDEAENKDEFATDGE